MIWLPRPFLYHRQVDPREARIESGAPDHVGNFGTSSVFELGLSVLNPGDPRNPFYTRFGQVLWLHPAISMRTVCTPSSTRTSTTCGSPFRFD